MQIGYGWFTYTDFNCLTWENYKLDMVWPIYALLQVDFFFFASVWQKKKKKAVFMTAMQLYISTCTSKTWFPKLMGFLYVGSSEVTASLSKNLHSLCFLWAGSVGSHFQSSSGSLLPELQLVNASESNHSLNVMDLHLFLLPLISSVFYSEMGFSDGGKMQSCLKESCPNQCLSTTRPSFTNIEAALSLKI